MGRHSMMAATAAPAMPARSDRWRLAVPHHRRQRFGRPLAAFGRAALATAAPLVAVLLLIIASSPYVCGGGDAGTCGGPAQDQGVAEEPHVKYCEGFGQEGVGSHTITGSAGQASGDDSDEHAAMVTAFTRSRAASFADIDGDQERALKMWTAAGGDCRESCYQGVLQSSLAIWRERGGITKEDFSSALSRGYATVHYVLEGGRVYRRGRCMFAARCEGIEHFLSGVLDSRPGLPVVELAVNVADHPQVLLLPS